MQYFDFSHFLYKKDGISLLELLEDLPSTSCIIKQSFRSAIPRAVKWACAHVWDPNFINSSDFSDFLVAFMGML
jgi:hypothetical protein